MNSVVSVISYIFCVIFLGSLIILVVMMCVNEFKRFFDRRKKNKDKVFKNKE